MFYTDYYKIVELKKEISPLTSGLKPKLGDEIYFETEFQKGDFVISMSVSREDWESPEWFEVTKEEYSLFINKDYLVLKHVETNFF